MVRVRQHRRKTESGITNVTMHERSITSNWKKQKQVGKNDVIHYVKRYDKKYGFDSMSLFIYKQTYIYKKDIDWMVVIDNHRGNEVEHRFKTKEHALQFAYSFMRRH